MLFAQLLVLGALPRAGRPGWKGMKMIVFCIVVLLLIVFFLVDRLEERKIDLEDQNSEDYL